MDGECLDRTPRFFLFSIRQIRFRLLPSDINRASSTAYPARSLLYVVWRNIGTPFCFTPINIGASAIRANRPGVRQANDPQLTSFMIKSVGNNYARLPCTRHTQRKE